MNKVLLDTDMLSEVYKAVDSQVALNAEVYLDEFGCLTTSALTVAEVIRGLQRVGRERKIQSFQKQVELEEVLPLAREAAEIAGRIYGDLERTGQPIGRIDPLIAGIAIHYDLTLVTGNQKHFERIVKLGYPLKIGNWRLAQS